MINKEKKERDFFVQSLMLLFTPSGKEPLPSPVEKEPPPPLPEKKVSAPPPPEKKPTSQASHSVSELHEGAPQSLHTALHPTMPKSTKKTVVTGENCL